MRLRDGGTMDAVTIGEQGHLHHRITRPLEQSSKLQNVLYEIRGPVHAHAARLEAEGHRILKLNIGNPRPRSASRHPRRSCRT